MFWSLSRPASRFLFSYFRNHVSLSGMCTRGAPSRRTVSVTFVWKDGRSKTVAAKVGDTFLDVVLDNNVDIDGFGACEGTLACSTCHLIFSPKDYENLNDPLSEDEQDMLDLACGLTDTCV
ncbi:adrenodoxin mitochondrial [Paragonimus heterotremus]|uniref:Adrenodoxin mitochondrial n=1 Tax=Paragonimus heterotremus TaxID=100268 RepID=A0A8J4SQ34_9TREM|nr:adrenodoxin mitochondrial [Paragonimus heterotremus]